MVNERERKEGGGNFRGGMQSSFETRNEPLFKGKRTGR